MPLTILIPKPPAGSPIRSLERLWLDTACAYEHFNETLMADTDWDHMAKELNDRKDEWSPYFKASLGLERWEGWNVGTTASGVDYSKGVPQMVYQHMATLDGDFTPIYEKHLKALFSGNTRSE